MGPLAQHRLNLVSPAVHFFVVLVALTLFQGECGALEHAFGITHSVLGWDAAVLTEMEPGLLQRLDLFLKEYNICVENSVASSIQPRNNGQSPVTVRYFDGQLSQVPLLTLSDILHMIHYEYIL